MKWSVNLGHRKLAVDLPDVLVENQAFYAKVENQTYKALWSSRTRTLIIEQNGVERLISLRSALAKRAEGDLEVQVAAELVAAGGAGVRAIAAKVTPDIPGLESRAKNAAQKTQILKSQITGKVLKVHVSVGETVAAGDTLLVIEAMKMENRVFAEAPGQVSSITVQTGDAVTTGRELLRIEPLAAES